MTHSMTRRYRLGAHVAAAALAGSALAFVAAPAHAAEADDPTFTPVASDLIGVGSDTTQISMHKAAEAYSTATSGFNVASFAATGGGQITLPSGAINRPNGSGAGKALLYGTGNNTDVDFARSSSTLSSAEISAGLQQFPFAVDTLVMAVSNNVTSHAPASLTKEQVVSIYKGDVTNWSQVGGTDGVIKPYIPQAGSGTRSFFVQQLTAANGGVAVTLGANVKEVQEHDDTSIKGDADAIAPFSKGRGELLGTTLRYLDGTFIFKRAVYNVVRGGAQGNADVQAFFGPSGFLCSNEAKDLIKAGGLEQMATAASGGACGEVTQNPVINYATNQSVATTTDLTFASTKAGEVTLTAAVTATNSPSGSVTFTEGDTIVAAAVPLSSGRAVATFEATPGEHTYTATFTPDSAAAFQSSEDEVTGVVVAGSSLTAAFPKSVKSGKKVVGTVTVKGVDTDAVPTGKVTVKVGSKTVATGTLAGGKVKLALGKITKKTTFVVTYVGDGTVAGATKKVVVKVTKK